MTNLSAHQRRLRSRPRVLLRVAAASMVLAGCASADSTPVPPVARQTDARDQESNDQQGLPSAHVHGIAANPADDRVYLATHDGLFRYGDSGPVRVGPVIDLMGFTVTGPDHFYASGHPGPGVELPEPVGLIESVDGGVTWAPLSRQGQSDFHALTSSDAGVVGFDGAAMSITTDGTTWRDLDPPVAPYALAASSDGAVLLATSESGLIRSIDAGDTWTAVDRAPLLQVVDWSERQTAVGVTPDGTVAVSDDNGNSWSERGRVNGPPLAVAALPTAQGQLRVLVVTDDGVWESTDGARTFGSLDTP